MNFRKILNQLTLIEDKDFSINDIDPEIIKKLQDSGFNTSVILFHGSNEVFTKFNKKFSRTAEHIYTSPDYETAGAYGEHLYACVGRTNPLADLVDDYNTINKVAEELVDYFIKDIKYIYPEEIKKFKSDLLQKLKKQQELFPEDPSEDDDDLLYDIDDHPSYEEFEKKLAKQYAANMIQSGEIYSSEGNSRFQDYIMNLCFGMGYNCVRFIDPVPIVSGGEPDSWVFDDGSDLYILKQLR